MGLYVVQCGNTNFSQAAVILKDLKMSEDHFDEFEHYNFDQEKNMMSGHSGKQRTKKESEQHQNWQNPAGHERKIATKLMNAERTRKLKIKPDKETSSIFKDLWKKFTRNQKTSINSNVFPFLIPTI